MTRSLSGSVLRMDQSVDELEAAAVPYVEIERFGSMISIR